MFRAVPAPEPVIGPLFSEKLTKASETKKDDIFPVMIVTKAPITKDSKDYNKLAECGLRIMQIIGKDYVHVKGNAKSILASGKLPFVKGIFELDKPVEICKVEAKKEPTSEERQRERDRKNAAWEAEQLAADRAGVSADGLVVGVVDIVSPPRPAR